MAVRYPKHAAKVAWARAQLGKGEQPPGSNTGSFVQLCQSATWLSGTRWAWCRAFNLRASLQGGFTLPDKSAGAWDALDRAHARGDALAPSAYGFLIPGDEVIWAFGSGHSSIFTGSTSSGGTVYIHSIDGNVGDKVEACSRPLSEVKGFIIWREQPVAAKPTKAPRAQVVGSVSGHRQLVTKNGKVLKLPSKTPGNHGIVSAPKPKPSPAPKPATKKAAPRVRYYTRKRNVKLAKGQVVGFKRGKGYFAKTKPAPKR